MPAFMQLAVSLVCDLGLNKAPADIHLPFCVDTHREPLPSSHRTMEDRRAVLGCFYTSSVSVLPRAAVRLSTDLVLVSLRPFSESIRSAGRRTCEIALRYWSKAKRLLPIGLLCSWSSSS